MATRRYTDTEVRDEDSGGREIEKLICQDKSHPPIRNKHFRQYVKNDLISMTGSDRVPRVYQLQPEKITLI